MSFRMRYIACSRVSCYIFSVPNVRINIRNIGIFLLKRRMRRENTLREAAIMLRIKPLFILCAALLTVRLQRQRM